MELRSLDEEGIFYAPFDGDMMDVHLEDDFWMHQKFWDFVEQMSFEDLHREKCKIGLKIFLGLKRRLTCA